MFFFFFFLGERGKRPLRGESAKTKESGMTLDTSFFSFLFTRFVSSIAEIQRVFARSWVVNSRNTKRVYNICYILEAEERVRRSFFSLSRRYVVYRVPNLVIQSAVAVLRINFILTVVIYNILHAVTRVQRQIYVRTQKMHTNTFKLVHEHAV